MESLNETIACYIEELVDIKRNKELTIEEKGHLINERDYIYNENKK